MLRLTYFVCLFALLGQLVATAAQMPRNSFLNRPVRSVSDLLRQVETDFQVRTRFQRHFAMSDSELRAFFSRLRLTRLAESGAYPVYNVPESGELGVKSRMLKKGTAVFVDQGGTPVLLKECGNPLMRGPKRPFTANTIPEGMLAGVEGELEVMPGEISVTPEEELFVSVLEPSVPEVVPVPPVVAPSPPVVTTGESDIPIGGILGILPALFFISGPGGGGAPIPEPASLLALSLGVGALIAKKRRRS